MVDPSSAWDTWLQVVWTFLRLSLFSLGGGNTLLAEYHHLSVERRDALRARRAACWRLTTRGPGPPSGGPRAGGPVCGPRCPLSADRDGPRPARAPRRRLRHGAPARTASARPRHAYDTRPPAQLHHRTTQGARRKNRKPLKRTHHPTQHGTSGLEGLLRLPSAKKRPWGGFWGLNTKKGQAFGENNYKSSRELERAVNRWV